jgi:hypothetical protein
MSRISNYEELVMERKRLEYELRKQKNALRLEVEEIKEKFQPVSKVLSLLGIFKRNDKPASALLKIGSSVGIDFLVKDKLLARAGWLTKTIASGILKGVSRLMINKQQSKST